jgi:Helix-turn-helix domain of resolvase
VKGVLSVEDWAEIRRLHRAEGMPIKAIARVMKVSRNTVPVLRDRVAEVRPAYLPPDPASRTAYEPGEVAQCDLWFPPIMLPVGFGQVRKPAQFAAWLALVNTRPRRTMWSPPP